LTITSTKTKTNTKCIPFQRIKAKISLKLEIKKLKKRSSHTTIYNTKIDEDDWKKRK
jgi:hypothetical protein